MGFISRKKSASSNGSAGHLPQVKLTHEDERNLKFRSDNVHDPILDLVNELQPYEQQTSHQRMSSLNQMNGMKDIFGAPILQPDISNPTRARDERPMDTIRSFEYAITGDPMFREQLETPQLGWRVRSTHTYGNTGAYESNPYSYSAEPQQQQTSAPQHQFEQLVYTPPTAPVVEKKKKKNFFGRKKN